MLSHPFNEVVSFITLKASGVPHMSVALKDLGSTDRFEHSVELVEDERTCPNTRNLQ